MKSGRELVRLPWGFTLPEILIAAVLMLLLLSLIFAFLVPTMRASVRGATRAEIQQEALLSIDKVTNDLLLSASSGVSLFANASGPVYLGIVRIEGIDNTGNRTWEQQIIVYSWKSEKEPIIRKVWKPSLPPSLGITLTPGSPSRYTESTLASIAQEPGLPGQILARDVSKFSITSAGLDSYVSSPIDLSIKITRQAATGRINPEVFEINRSISLRSQI